ncbi:hypothetical protein GCM10010255_40470 [Streptomyces coeruleofuscus]|uniref:Uncharacterized protein n=1 Tax=Streptomyces coeruleofuscus TaxID=66879 RepID=A0ABP5VGJ6_9ACTN
MPKPTRDVALGGDVEEQVAGGVGGFAVGGKQDALTLVTFDEGGQVVRGPGEVAVPGVGAGCVGLVGVGVRGTAEGALDVAPQLSVGLAVAGTVESELGDER